MNKAEDELTFPDYVLDKKLESCIDLLWMSDKNKAYYVYIIDINRFIRNKSNKNNRKTLANTAYNVLEWKSLARTWRKLPENKC